MNDQRITKPDPEIWILGRFVGSFDKDRNCCAWTPILNQDIRKI